MRKFAVATAAIIVAIAATAVPALASSPASVVPRIGCWTMPHTPKTCTEHWPPEPLQPSPQVDISENFVNHPFIEIVNESLWCFGTDSESINQFTQPGGPDPQETAPREIQIFASASGIAIHKNGRFSRTVTGYGSDARFRVNLSGRFFTPTTGTMTVSTSYHGCGSVKQTLKLTKPEHFNANK